MQVKAFSLLLLAGTAHAHMSLWYPGPLGGTREAKIFSTNDKVDPELNWPLGCCDSEGKPTAPSPGVCRGHLDLFDSEDAQVTWQPGQDAYFQLSDYTYTVDAPGATHDGGSCQVGFSTDRGETWKVAASYNGNCPLRGGDGSPEVQTFDFKVPTGMPSGKALFAWIWLNREHESFMNCAVVRIADGSGNEAVSTRSTTFDILTAEVAIPSSSVLSSSSVTRATDSYHPMMSARPTSFHGNRITELSRAVAPHDHDAIEAGVHAKPNDPESESFLRTKEEGVSERRQSVKLKTSNGYRNKDESRPGRSGRDHSSQEQSLAGLMTLRASRRDARKKGAGACAWDTAPSMMISYYTIDAACAPNAKIIFRDSDSFEIGWNEPCGVVEGDGEYPIKVIDCDMFS
ncbi:hypothetical protein EJ07DRAFT_138053 [Lizonia empirigonia]|nr:hypothetical protein EJ07DRAFT_138053 [Lizonia empirigonia]